MECTSEKCKRNLRKRLQIIHGSINVSSESSLSFGNSEAHFHHLQSLSKKRKKASCHSKSDYLSRLFERKKLKDKSLSKKLRTPFDRKINRTCWPIELSKISKIKKKPREKRREKPTHRSLTRREYSDSLIIPYCRENSPQVTCSESEIHDDDDDDDEDDDDDDDDSLNAQSKFSNPMFISCCTKRHPHIFCTGYSMKTSSPDFLSRFRARSPAICCSLLRFISDDYFRNKFSKLKFFSQYRASSSRISCCELEFLNEDLFNIVYQYVKKKCSPHKYDHVTPEMLLEVLRDPEYLETGATIDMIVQQIRIQNKNLNPEVHLLTEEVAINLLWTIALGVIVEENGYYKIAENFEKENENISLIWDWWCRRMKNVRN